MEHREINWTRSKEWIQYLLMALFLALGSLMVLVERESLVFYLMQLVASLSLPVLIFWWCLSDSMEGDYPMGKWLALGILLAPYVGVPIYYLRGRGLGLGLLMLGKAMLFCLLLGGLSLAAAGITIYVAGASLPSK